MPFFIYLFTYLLCGTQNCVSSNQNINFKKIALLSFSVDIFVGQKLAFVEGGGVGLRNT